MRIAVVGGSAAGLVAALLLARAGHDVTVVERDPLTPAADVEAAAAAGFRASAPQLVHPHVLLALCRELLREHLPDVYRELLDAGVVEADLASQMAPTLADRAQRPGDERLSLLMTRRSTVDWVLTRHVLTEPALDVRDGIRVTGLRAEPGDPPRVTGISTDRGSVPADVVVDATGRRSPIDAWLAGIGARPTEMAFAECGVSYYSRHYRLRTRTGLPGPPTTRVVAALDEFAVGIWGADHDTMLLALCPLSADHRFRAVRHPDTHTAVIRSVPYYAGWLDVLEPISDVFPMAGLHNTLRRLVVDGRPVATGLQAVGDSVCTTNPTLGRGLSLAVRQAVDLVGVLAAHPDDATAQAAAMDRAVAAHVQPYYADQAEIDAGRLAVLRHRVLGAPAPAPPVADGARVSYAQLRSAAPHDADAFRAFWTIMGMLRPPEQVYRDPELVARVLDTLATHGTQPMAQPDPAQLRAALGV